MFSIIVNCYNGAKYLKETISTILNINYDKSLITDIQCDIFNMTRN